MNDLMDSIIATDVVEDSDNILGGENLNDIAQMASDQGDPDNYTIALDRPVFSKFTSSLAIIQDVCGDCDIKGGLVRCKSNDRKNFIAIDFQSIIQNRNISFSGLKTKLNLLKSFELEMNVQGADNMITILSDANNFEFSDCFSKLVMRKPMANYLENKFVDQADFASNIQDLCREDNLLFSYSIDNYLKNRIAQICNTFRCDSVVFEFHGGYCKLGTETKTKDNVLKNSQQINLNFSVDNKKTVLNNLAFILNIQSAINISCYKVGDQFALFKSDLVNYGIPFTIYNKTKILDME